MMLSEMKETSESARSVKGNVFCLQGLNLKREILHSSSPTALIHADNLLKSVTHHVQQHEWTHACDTRTCTCVCTCACACHRIKTCLKARTGSKTHRRRLTGSWSGVLCHSLTRGPFNISKKEIDGFMNRRGNEFVLVAESKESTEIRNRKLT